MEQPQHPRGTTELRLKTRKNLRMPRSYVRAPGAYTPAADKAVSHQSRLSRKRSARANMACGVVDDDRGGGGAAGADGALVSAAAAADGGGRSRQKGRADLVPGVGPDVCTPEAETKRRAPSPHSLSRSRRREISPPGTAWATRSIPCHPVVSSNIRTPAPVSDHRAPTRILSRHPMPTLYTHIPLPNLRHAHSYRGNRQGHRTAGREGDTGGEAGSQRPVCDQCRDDWAAHTG